MKKILLTGVVIVAALVMTEARALSLADASGKIGEVVESPASMTETLKQLSAEDQVAYLARVNAAIDALPGSPTEKAAKYLSVNSAALKGAAKGNLAALLAEVFATVPPEALTVINERFAAELFNRSANPEKPVSDEAMEAIAKKTMAAIQARTATSDNTAVRDTFAVLMFLRASEGKPADLADTLVSQFTDEKARELAKTEWIPSAMGDPKSYEPMLGASDAGEQPEASAVLAMVGAEASAMFLADLSDNTGSQSFANAGQLNGFSIINDPLTDPVGIDRIPRTMDKSKPWNGSVHRGEPNGYYGQGTGY